MKRYLDVLNTMSLPMKELKQMFENFSPTAMLVSRVNSSVRFNVSALENITLAILSDN